MQDGDIFDLPSDQESAADGKLPERHTDGNLQTALSGETLQTNLLRLDQQARSALDERGVNILFLAVGFLKRPQAKGSQETFLAPLVLIPAALDRASAKQRFKLCALSDDPEVNPCLAAMLEQEFRIKLPEMPEDWVNEFDLDSFLEETAKSIAGQRDWDVVPSMCLGLFSFTKYMMYKDLDPNRWPSGKSLLDNPWIRCLLAPDEAPIEQDMNGVPDPRDLDEFLSPSHTYQVLDADSSQLRVICAAKLGKTMVVQGPPGTGKSQTIANIIAECLSEGKTVLFVSEKMAALQVVKRRLDAVGLGDFCFELHSTKANRGAVIRELSRVLEKVSKVSVPDAGAAETLTQLRSRLTNYTKALHAPFEPAGLSPYAAMGKALLLQNACEVPCQMPGFEMWNSQQFQQMRELVNGLSRSLRSVEPVTENVWHGVRLRSLDVQLIESVRDLLRALPVVIAEAERTAHQLSGCSGDIPPSTFSEIQEQLDAGETIADSPESPSRLLREALWDGADAERQDLLRKCNEFLTARKSLSSQFEMGQTDSIDCKGLYQRCLRHSKSYLRWFSSEFRRDRATLRNCLVHGRGGRLDTLLPGLRKLCDMQGLMQEITPAGRKYFDDSWLGAESDWGHLKQLAKWLPRFRGFVNRGMIKENGIVLASRGHDRSALASCCEASRLALKGWQEQWSHLAQVLCLQDPGVFPGPANETPFAELSQRFRQMLAQMESLFDWVRFQNALQKCEKGPLSDFVAKALQHGLTSEQLPPAMERRYHRLLIDRMIAQRDELREFDTASHEEDRRAFAAADRKWITQSSQRLQALLVQQRPVSGIKGAPSSQLGILQGEAVRKRSRKPIRQLLREAREPIQKLKPCFMMSPLSVAQFIAPDGIRFDLVVFDEASQVEPADALGAIARGDQLLLLGDPKQLPPTSFFSAICGESEGSENEGAASLRDVDSILDRAKGILPSMDLNWHYRSRHESLISFSNHEFYDNNLLVFPSCHSCNDNLGLSLVYEPSDMYDRGRSQTNRAQARRVAEYVFRVAKEHPEKSIGVGAFSMRQQQAILDEIERLRREDESMESFFDTNKQEPFFVKNLETIQGDERDFIILSIGYGKDQPGGRLSMNFGPLNQDKGWRRLNVLITRAREKCVVVSSIEPGDFDLSATNAQGVRALCGYLEYARTRRIPTTTPTQEDFGSPFEEAVFNALRDCGIEVRKQVGCVGYAIDMAVVDPEKPGRYLLGIECDGATYHSHATARDRDRLRQQVLEDLGWRIHRVWSTDWYRKPQQELNRILAVIEEAKADCSPSSTTQEKPDLDMEDDLSALALPTQPVPPAPTVEPYRRYAGAQYGDLKGFEIELAATLAGDKAQTLRAARDIVETEGPIHLEEFMRRLAGLWQVQRIGRSIRAKIEEAVETWGTEGVFEKKGEFLWPCSMQLPPVRQRVDDADRKIEFICGEEIAQAAVMALNLQFGMNRDDLVLESARLLGFKRATPDICHVINDAIDLATKSGWIQWPSPS